MLTPNAQSFFSRLDSIGPGHNVLGTWTRIVNWHLSATLMTTKTVCDILEILWTTNKKLLHSVWHCFMTSKVKCRIDNTCIVTVG